ncbi:hypothetical protein JI735_27540 [Paenibacillus sonchi]|uniref:Uncharacterized protein n=1 Tax=Paenibacillus sonchi TaxID=373687 RepID=A0A974SB89_9BACL|nr:hypothetical protein [Paenibacillus sonchi]QQZ60238.1 hypothetical protein JI735_27540 [Paenibacillus sonchi]
MNKLDGNEHWKTKMIMTEHVEQFEGQQRDAGISDGQEDSWCITKYFGEDARNDLA